MDYLLTKADARRIPLPDGSVQCCITSPPYYGLRDYGSSGQIGLEPTHLEYIAGLVAVFREVRRVLRDDGTVWLNLGDTYNAYNGNAGPSSSISKGRHDSARPDLARGHGLLNKALKPKDLLMIPHRVAIALQDDGWFVRADIVWHKPNPMPESVRDRPTKSHEYLFLMAKQERYYYDADAVREPGSANPVTLARKCRADNGAVGTSAIWGDGYGQSGKGSNASVREESGRNLRSVWTINPQPFPGAHFATFPAKLVEPCVKAGTSERGQCPACGTPWVRDVVREPMVLSRSGRADAMGEFGRTCTSGTMVSPPKSRTVGWSPSCSCGAGEPVPQIVLDPFNGSGTTGLVATGLGRRYVGLDLSADYLAMARRRLERPHAPVPKPGRDDAPLPLFGPRKPLPSSDPTLDADPPRAPLPGQTEMFV